jgi:hypothetical protein
LAGCIYGEIFLAYVDACGFCDVGDVGAVVDDDADGGGSCGDQSAGHFEKLAWWNVFGAELDQLHAGGREFLGHG